MRKLLSIVLCLVMVFCFTVPAMAAVDTPVNDVHVIAPGTTVTNEVQVTTAVNPVYRVTVTWDKPITFGYNFGAWNTTELKYAPEGWTDKVAKNVVVTNYSNADVAINATVTQNYLTDGLEVLLDNANFTLDSADTGAAVGTATSDTITVGVKDQPLKDANKTYKETLTVTVSAV